MPLRKYTEEQKNFIAENVVGTTTKELVSLVNDKFGLNVTESQMKSYKTNHRLKSGTPCGGIPGKETKLFPEKIKNFISENFVGTGHKDMAEQLNKKFGTNYTAEQIKAYYSRFKLDSGLTGYFPKGHVPANKGKKGMGGWEPTQFKKGNVPANWVPIGSERVNGDGYVDIKVADGKKQKNWKGKHIVLWEKENGLVPKGHVVIFGDGNNRNFDISNLLLVSRKQLAILNKNKLIKKDADLTRTAIIMADVCLKIGERKSKNRR